MNTFKTKATKIVIPVSNKGLNTSNFQISSMEKSDIHELAKVLSVAMLDNPILA